MKSLAQERQEALEQLQEQAQGLERELVDERQQAAAAEAELKKEVKVAEGGRRAATIEAASATREMESMRQRLSAAENKAHQQASRAAEEAKARRDADVEVERLKSRVSGLVRALQGTEQQRDQAAESVGEAAGELTAARAEAHRLRRELRQARAQEDEASSKLRAAREALELAAAVRNGDDETVDKAARGVALEEGRKVLMKRWAAAALQGQEEAKSEAERLREQLLEARQATRHQARETEKLEMRLGDVQRELGALRAREAELAPKAGLVDADRSALLRAHEDIRNLREQLGDMESKGARQRASVASAEAARLQRERDQAVRRAQRLESRLEEAEEAGVKAEERAAKAKAQAERSQRSAAAVVEKAQTSTRALAHTAAAAERRRDLAEKRAERAGARVRFGRFGRLDDDDDDEGEDGDKNDGGGFGGDQGKEEGEGPGGDGEEHAGSPSGGSSGLRYSQMDLPSGDEGEEEEGEEEEAVRRKGRNGRAASGRSRSPLELKRSRRGGAGRTGSSGSGSDRDEYAQQVGALHDELARAKTRGSYPGAPLDEPIGSPTTPGMTGGQSSGRAGLGRTQDPSGVVRGRRRANAGSAEAQSAQQLREEVRKYREARRGR